MLLVAGGGGLANSVFQSSGSFANLSTTYMDTFLGLQKP